jgi:hypothetical protein
MKRLHQNMHCNNLIFKVKNDWLYIAQKCIHKQTQKNCTRYIRTAILTTKITHFYLLFTELLYHMPIKTFKASLYTQIFKRPAKYKEREDKPLGKKLKSKILNCNITTLKCNSFLKDFNFSSLLNMCKKPTSSTKTNHELVL